MNSHISMVALDLDGTTLNSNCALSSKTIDTLRNLSSNGVTISIATGRSVVAVRKHVEVLNLDAEIPVVCTNGCCGYSMSVDNENVIEKSIYSKGLNPAESKALIEFGIENGFVIQYYNRDTGQIYAINRLHEDHSSLLAKYTGLTSMIQTDVAIRNPISNEIDHIKLDAFLEEIPAAKILLLHEDADYIYHSAIGTLPNNTYSIIKGSPHPFFVEFLPHGITKGTGLQIMCDHLNISPDSVVAFGDGENDVEFLKYAGIGVAMKNARNVTKDVADVVLDRTNDEDGVAHHLEEMKSRKIFKEK